MLLIDNVLLKCLTLLLTVGLKTSGKIKTDQPKEALKPLRQLCCLFTLLVFVGVEKAKHQRKHSHVDKAGSIVRIVFDLDFSSALNMIQPALLYEEAP